MMAREECGKGFIVSFVYSADELSEIGRFFKQTGRVILDEQIVHKLV